MTGPTKSRMNRRLAEPNSCTGCGTCYAMCPADAIVLTIDPKRGTYCPRIDVDRCTDCGICTEVCPGLSLDIDSITQPIFDSSSKDALYGHLEKCYIAHATNHEIRYSSASGGLVTTLLITALEEGWIDGALVTRMDEGNPLRPEPFIARTKQDILSASCSKYCPVPANKAIRKLLESEGRFAVVGLPCHLHGIRKAERVNEDLKRKVVLHLGLFCSHTLSYHATRHLLRRIGVSPGNIVKIDYRGRGWPGGLMIRERNGEEHFIPNHDPYWNTIFNSHFFTPEPCLWCTDLTSELSDLSFGDPWLPEIMKGERIGKSLVISRTQMGEKILSEARDQQKIETDLVDPDVLIMSQGMYTYFKKGNSEIRQRIGGGPQPHSTYRVDERHRLMGGLVAVVTILNSSMGRNRVLRGILDRIPSTLLCWYSAKLNRIISIDMGSQIQGRAWRK